MDGRTATIIIITMIGRMSCMFGVVSSTPTAPLSYDNSQQNYGMSVMNVERSDPLQ